MALLTKPMIITIIVQFSLLIISSISLSKCDQTTETTSNINHITTIDLHHLDLSSSSPYYDPSLSHYQRVAKALQRLSAHANHGYLASKQTPAVAPTIEDNLGSYFLDYSIGSVTLKGILDTGSDLIWTPCSNVNIRSGSFKTIACKTPQCGSLPGNFCGGRGRCSYQMVYGDGSNTTGYLFTDTITLGSAQFPNIIFGCGTRNYFSKGIFGLGGGAVSLVKQIRIGKFSYCLVSYNSVRTTSKLHLGDNPAVVPGASIPLVRDSGTPTFYNVKLVSITVGNKPATNLKFGKNMILDTGTGTTNLPRTLYYGLLNALRASIGKNNITDPNGGPFELCYSSAPGKKFPDITLDFGNNVNVKWKQENVFAKLGPVTVWCFAAFWIDDNQEAIFGNLAQANYLVGFDLFKNTVTIQPQDCGSSN